MKEGRGLVQVAAYVRATSFRTCVAEHQRRVGVPDPCARLQERVSMREGHWMKTDHAYR